MKNEEFLLKYNVELFTINVKVNLAKSEGLGSVCIESPVFKISYEELNSIAEYLANSKKYWTVETDYSNRRNANNPSGVYSDKKLLLYWE
jgi:hypothetical protein